MDTDGIPPDDILIEWRLHFKHVLSTEFDLKFDLISGRLRLFPDSIRFSLSISEISNDIGQNKR